MDYLMRREGEKTALTDFLNHGLLPFTGRDKEVERIIAFQQRAIDFSGLASLLIIGEAGIGKSRLIEEVMDRAEKKSGGVIHIRLLPESTIALSSLLADSLWRRNMLRSLLRVRPTKDIGSVIEAIRRIVQLRPTLLIIEDIHLLEGESLTEFSRLVDGLRDDPIGLLCAMRPYEAEARPLLTATLVETIELEGLHKEAIQHITENLFAERGDPQAIELLTKATAGNPLALRSALRGALGADTIRQKGSSGEWHVNNKFAQIVHESSKQFSKGLAVGLTPTERQGAALLASLGEHFSEEAAGIVLGEEASSTIEHLLFKGIIYSSASRQEVLPRLDDLDGTDFAFTHTLVHSQFLDTGSPPYQRLLEAIRQYAPIYSLLPFRLLGTTDGEKIQSIPWTALEEMLTVLFELTEHLQMLDMYRHLDEVWNVIEMLRDKGEWPCEKQAEVRYRVMNAQLNCMGLQVNETYQELAYSLLAETASSSEQDLIWHVAGLNHVSRYHLINGSPEELLHTFELTENFVKKHPKLTKTEHYAHVLRNRAGFAMGQDEQYVRATIEKLQELIRRGDLDTKTTSILKRALYLYLLHIVYSPKDLEERERWIEDVETSGLFEQYAMSSWLLAQYRLMFSTGQIDRALALNNQLLQQHTINSTPSSVIVFNNIECQSMLGIQPVPTDVWFTSFTEKYLPVTVPVNRNRLAEKIVTFAFLRGEIKTAHQLATALASDLTRISASLQTLLVLYQESETAITPKQIVTLLNELDPGWFNDKRYGLLKRIVQEKSTDTILTVLTEIAQRPVLTIKHLIDLHITLRAAMSVAEERKEMRPHIKEQGQVILLNALTWLSQRKLGRLMLPLLEMYGTTYLQQQAIDQWIKNAQRYQKEHQQRYTKEKQRTTHLSLIGEIEFRFPEDDQPLRLKGERLRILLGTMGANELLQTRLSRDEFLRIASGEADYKQARWIVNSTVKRLRQAIHNPDLILTDGTTPRLNTERVEIDLLQLQSELKHVETSLQTHTPGRGIIHLENVLKIWNGNVMFPTLYDEFFESMREEFETWIRRTTLRMVQLLNEEHDVVSATHLLKHLQEIIPEDDEVTERFAEMLEKGGNKVEASRIRNRSAT